MMCSGRSCIKEEEPATNKCPDDFMPSIEPFTCVWFSGYGTSWWSAYKECHEVIMGAVIVLYNDKWMDWLCSINTERRFLWTGLSSLDHDGKWTWSTGMDATFFQWASSEPDNNIGHQLCVFLEPGVDGWADTECYRERYFVCMAPHPKGPQLVKVELVPHLAPDVVYFDHVVNITCSAFYPEGGNLVWSATKNNTSVINLPNVTVHTEYVLETHPIHYHCANKTISTLSFKPTTDMRSLYFSCFGRKGAESEICNKNKKHMMQMCGGLKVNFQEGPKKPPTAFYIYDGAPGPVVRGAFVHVNCTVHTGEVGELVWVVNFASGPKILGEEDEQIINQTVYNDPIYGRTETSIIQFLMKPALRNISVTCFSHKVSEKNKNLNCPKNDFFCTKLLPLTVQKATTFYTINFIKHIPEWLKPLTDVIPLEYFAPIPFILLIFTIPMWYYRHHGEESEEDNNNMRFGMCCKKNNKRQNSQSLVYRSDSDVESDTTTLHSASDS